ncbi:hypothetical protein ACFY7C_17660 [Streptomyces sp. NPDC012769]|uniref:hypothetical protein n=1 Tax=Streptomyces sp. NPDC012769 TaxID=3364848 RepID=UPI0036B7049E
MTRILHRVLGAAAVAGAAALTSAGSAAPAAAADGPLPLVGLLAPDHDRGSDRGSGGGDASNATVAGNASTSVIGGTTAG